MPRNNGGPQVSPSAVSDMPSPSTGAKSHKVGPMTHISLSNPKTAKAAQAFKKTKLCKFYLAGGCTRGTQCAFAHSETDLRATPDLYRTQMCQRLAEKGACDDPNCRYAHRRSELRHVSLRPDANNDVAPGRTKLRAPVNTGAMPPGVPSDGPHNTMPLQPTMETMANCYLAGKEAGVQPTGLVWIPCPMMRDDSWASGMTGDASTYELEGSTTESTGGSELRLPETSPNSFEIATGESCLVQNNAGSPLRVYIKNTFLHAEPLQMEEAEVRGFARSSSSPPWSRQVSVS